VQQQAAPVALLKTVHRRSRWEVVPPHQAAAAVLVVAVPSFNLVRWAVVSVLASTSTIPTLKIRTRNRAHRPLVGHPVVVLPEDFPASPCALGRIPVDRITARTLEGLLQPHTRQLVPIIPKLR
jgi:hypothetical protein